MSENSDQKLSVLNSLMLTSIDDRIKTEWGKRNPVVSLLMLDVSRAYNKVSHERLSTIFTNDDSATLPYG